MSSAPDGAAASAHAPAPDLSTASPALPDPVRITPPPGARVRIEPEGFPPPPHAPLDATMPRPGMGGDPDWLTERLARDAAMHSRAEWSGRWSRRVGTWGAAGVLLALLAGGGFWLYQQSEVEGALVVVANTNPAPPAVLAAPARPGLVRGTTGVPGDASVAAAGDRAAAVLPVTPAATATPAPTMPMATPGTAPSAETRNATGVDATGGLAGPSTAAAAGEAAAAAGASTGTRAEVRETPEPASSIDGTNRTVVAVPAADGRAVSPPKRPRSHAKKRTKVEARAAEPAREPSARQRREETLMQCRAHGYDERQCLQRGCEMTRFGFACKG
jgi:hypothetical protein